MATVGIPAVETKDGSKSAAIPGQSVVAAQDLIRRYGDGDTAVDALRGVSLDVTKGKLTAVMGPSGSGKSTLMHILAGLDKATSGEVTIAGTAISKLNDTELTLLRRQHIGFIFQFFNLLPMLNAEENVVLPLSLAGEKPDKEWVAELMAKIGLEERSSGWSTALGTVGIFALGCLVGAGIGLAFAPKSGEDFRNELGDRMRRKADELGMNQDMMTRSQMPVT